MSDLDRLFEPMSPSLRALAEEVLGLVRSLRPDFTEKVSLAWATVNFHFRKGFIAAIYVRGDHVSLVFQDGRLLDSPLLVDDGKVKKVRWIPFRPGDSLPVDEIAILLAEAVALRS